jgi:hypothetical protein
MTSMKQWMMSVAMIGAFSTSTLADEVKSVTTTGEGPFDGKDLIAAENAAKRAARRAAVEQGAGVLMESTSIVRNYELISDEIVSSASGVIVNEQWGPLQDGPTGSTKKITLTAQVSKAGLSSAMCTVIKANHDPKVALVIVEKHGEQSWVAERGVIEAMYSEAFSNNCFRVVDPMIDVAAVSGTGSLPKEAVDKIVDAVDAQYVVLGSVKVGASKSIAGMTTDANGLGSYPFDVSLKLINVANGEVVAAVAESGQAMGISEALALGGKTSNFRKNGLDVSMKNFFEKITKSWSNDLVNASNVSLTLQGANKSLADDLRAILNARSGVRAEQRRMSGGKATFDIVIDGGAQALADVLQGKKLGNGKIEVTETQKGKVVITVVK